MKRAALAAFLFSLVAASGPAAEKSKGPKKPDRPFSIYVFSPTEQVATPSKDEQEVIDSTEDVRKRLLSKHKDWFTLVTDKEKAEIVLQVDKRGYQAGHGHVIEAKVAVLDVFEGPVIGQGGLDSNQIFGIWRTAASDVAGRVEGFCRNVYEKLVEARRRGVTPEAVAATNRGDARGKDGDLDGALREYDAAIRVAPGYARAHFNRGLAHADKKEHAQAVADFTESLRLEPNDRAAHVLRGTAYGELGEQERAIADYDEALRIDPKHARAFFKRGNVYLERGDTERAIADYTAAIDLEPTSEAWYNRGLAHQRAGRRERAALDFGNVLFKEPNNLDALLHRGLCHLELGDHDKAISDYDKAIALAPAEALAYFNRAKAYAAKGLTQRARADRRKALELDPGLAEDKPR